MPILLLKRARCNLLCKHISTFADATFSLPTSTSHQIESWITRISSLSQLGSGSEHSLLRASEQLNSGTEDATGYALVHLIRASTDLSLESYCSQLHCYVIKCGFTSDVVVSTALMRFYRATKLLCCAHEVFDEIPQPNVVSWNTLISGYVRSGKFKQALGLFVQLERSDVCADAYSLTAALSACGQLSMLQFGRSVHCKIIKDGVDCGVFVPNCLIDMYGKCGLIEEAIRVFDGMDDRDTISWNSIIAACGRNHRLDLASSFFRRMPEPDTVSYNELINGIAQFGHIEDAVEILYTMPNPNSSSWNSILTGYVNRSRALEAMDFFTRMHSSGVRMDEYTYSSLLSGIASLAALRWGTAIHCCIVKCSLSATVVVGSALIDMYSKCGEVSNADSIFHSLPHKNLVTWNAIIAGHAQSGDSKKVIQLFEELKTVKGLDPDWITFLNVLASCSNTKVPLETATQYFESMINDYGITPSIEHCCSMIRLMGQNSEALCALRMIYDFGFGSCPVVWRALLGACGNCANLQVAKIAAAKVIELDGDDDYVYVTMSNISASCGKWGDVKKVRHLMWKKRVNKEVGCSWIEVANAEL
ncbi:Putative pentatricopeptide repeat-containing protein At5g47460 [Linum perenne]